MPLLHRRAAGLAAAVATMVASSGCAGSEPPAPGADGVTTLRYQATPGLVSHAELADALGYLDDIRIENVGAAQGGPEQLRGLASGEADFASGPFHGATMRLVATGRPVRAVVASYGSSHGVGMSLLTRESSEIDGPRDLVGRTIGVNTLGANSEAVIDTYLAGAGLDQEEIEQVALVPLPSATLEAGLRHGQVDAALVSFAAKESAMRNGGVEVLATDTDFIGEYTGGSTVVEQQLIDERPEVVREFVGALARAIRFQQTHSRDQVLDVYGAWLGEHGRGAELAAFELWKGNGVPGRGGVLDEDDFGMWVNWLESNDELPEGSVHPRDVFTNEFNPYAKETQG